jgi:hypothetical protein
MWVGLRGLNGEINDEYGKKYYQQIKYKQRLFKRKQKWEEAEIEIVSFSFVLFLGRVRLFENKSNFVCSYFCFERKKKSKTNLKTILACFMDFHFSGSHLKKAK